jgi:hypothetical protein
MSQFAATKVCLNAKTCTSIHTSQDKQYLKMPAIEIDIPPTLSALLLISVLGRGDLKMNHRSTNTSTKYY